MYLTLFDSVVHTTHDTPPMYVFGYAPLVAQPNDAPERSIESDTKRGEEDLPSVVNGEEDFADEQRRAMRMALARRMKRELVETERDRLTKVLISGDVHLLPPNIEKEHRLRKLS